MEGGSGGGVAGDVVEGGGLVKVRRCMWCGGMMQEGMLPGWWTCRCGFFMDLQEAGSFQILQYSLLGMEGGTARDRDRSVVPLGCLLVVEGREVW